MILFCSCTNCKSEIKIKFKARDRGELIKDYGNRLSIICDNCKESIEISPNNVHARINNLSGFAFPILFICMIFVGVSLFLRFGTKSIYVPNAILVGCFIPFGLYFVYISEEQKKVRIFNSFRVKN